MERRYHSRFVYDGDLPLQLQMPHDWLISGLVLMSMTLQLVLVFSGSFRYRSSSNMLALVVWLGYMCGDAVAIYALGAMLHSSVGIVYGVWAPLLLLHLGGPDSITAYSIPDNELWIRHLFILLSQVSVVAYVICISSLQLQRKGEWYLIVAGCLIFVVGCTKYGERTLALRFASYPQIVSSIQPIYEFMEHEHEIDEAEYNYIVNGEKLLHDEFTIKRESGSFKLSKDFLLQTGTVTIKDVLDCEGGHVTDKYIVCVSYALFKMYKRRFASLRFHERDYSKSRRFFFNGQLSSENIFKILEIEMKFIYDFLFSKFNRTAVNEWGMAMRMGTTSLLTAAWYLIFHELKEKGKDGLNGQRIVTYILISVALAVEVFQLCRIIVSDWTIVWLICVDIRQFHRKKHSSGCGAVLMKSVMWVLFKVRKMVGHKYWKNQIQQHRVIETCLNISTFIWKVREILGMPDFIMSLYVKTEPIEHELKSFVFEKIKEICNPEEDVESCMRNFFSGLPYEKIFWCLDNQDFGAEQTLIIFHIGTAICEKEDSWTMNANIRFSGMLSRYLIYLMVSCPNLLALHPDIAKMYYNEVYSEINELVRIHHRHAADNDFYDMLKKQQGKLKKRSILGRSTAFAGRLLETYELEERWELLGNLWVRIVMYNAHYNKATFHGERLAFGGEFLTQVWMLLAHMGCGEQSDSATRESKDLV